MPPAAPRSSWRTRGPRRTVSPPRGGPSFRAGESTLFSGDARRSVSADARMPEPALYRPFALVAFAAAVLGGAPLGVWMLAWLYGGAPATPTRWVLLHASLQIFGFFGTLIPGVAPHLVARFPGRPLAPDPLTRPLLALLAAGLALRVAGTWVDAPAWLALAALLRGAALAALRWGGGGWGGGGGGVGGGCRRGGRGGGGGGARGAGAPDLGAMRAVYALALYGG